jgi:hypothetical protein
MQQAHHSQQLKQQLPMCLGRPLQQLPGMQQKQQQQMRPNLVQQQVALVLVQMGGVRTT